MRLTREQIALIANALNEKAAGDRAAAVDALKDTAGGRVAVALENQALMAVDLADRIGIAHAVEVLP